MRLLQRDLLGWLVVRYSQVEDRTPSRDFPGFAKTVADTMVFMDNAEIVESAPTEAFFEAPKSDRTKLFLSQVLSH